MPSRTRSPSSTLATSASRPARRAGTARRSASSAPSTTNGRTPASGPTAPNATAHWHPSCATTTAEGPTPHSVTGRPSAAFAKTWAGHLDAQLAEQERAHLVHPLEQRLQRRAAHDRGHADRPARLRARPDEHGQGHAADPGLVLLAVDAVAARAHALEVGVQRPRGD